eukprot:gene27428-4728_t
MGASQAKREGGQVEIEKRARQEVLDSLRTLPFWNKMPKSRCMASSGGKLTWRAAVKKWKTDVIKACGDVDGMRALLKANNIEAIRQVCLSPQFHKPPAQAPAALVRDGKKAKVQDGVGLHTRDSAHAIAAASVPASVPAFAQAAVEAMRPSIAAATVFDINQKQLQKKDEQIAKLNQQLVDQAQRHGTSRREGGDMEVERPAGGEQEEEDDAHGGQQRHHATATATAVDSSEYHKQQVLASQLPRSQSPPPGPPKSPGAISLASGSGSRGPATGGPKKVLPLSARLELLLLV